MGSLVDGVWVEEDNVNSSSGSFVRPESVFRHWVTKDGSPGPHGDGGFEANLDVIICMFRITAPGLIVLYCSGVSKVSRT